MLIDTHAHLDFPDFDLDRSEIIQRTLDENMLIINVGSDFEATKRAVDLSSQFQNIYSCLGFHPHDAIAFNHEVIGTYRELAKNKKVVAVGEIGLDYFRNLSPRHNQKEVFTKMLTLAKDLNLPVVVHSRQADDEVLEILKKFMPLKGVVHCFSSTQEFLGEILELGFLVSFTANITYKKAQNLRDLVKIVPKDRFMLETDCPFLPPEGFRGKRNDPLYVKYVAQEISKIRNESVEEIAQYTTQNARNFFGV